MTARRWLVTVLLAVIAPWGGLLGCTVNQPWSHRPASIESLSPPPATGQPVWRGAIPRAQILGAHGTGETGLLLSSRWFAPSGEVRTTAPDGSPVRWPPAVPVAASARVDMRIPSRSAPTMVDVRLFPGPVGDNGVPASEPQIMTCRDEWSPPAGAPTGCVLQNDEKGILVSLTRPAAFPVIVLYAEWYVPVDRRPAKARNNAVVSASWGFRTTPG